MTASADRLKVYARFSCGEGAEVRVLLTVRRGSPVVDIRYGELAKDRWQPSGRGISFKPSDVPALLAAVKAAATDIQRLDLIDNDCGWAPANAIHRRWNQAH